MKTLLLLLTLAASALPARAETIKTESKSTRYIVGISPFLQNAEKDEVFRKIAGFLLEDAGLGSSLWLYDAYHLRTISQINVPDARAFRSSKTRANQFKEQIGKLREFLATKHETPSARGLSFDRALRFPQFMDFVGENLAGTGVPVAIVLLGSPLYVDPKEPSFSMVEGAFPSDGHLLASRDQSVYGLKTRDGALQEARVHFCWFGDPWVSEVHHEKVGRFWSLYLDKQGANLATFCGDLPTTFNAVRGSAGEPLARARHELDRANTKVEMLRISRDVAEGDWITRDVVSNAASTPPSTTVGPMKIGIRWKGNIDLDLYATPSQGAQTLFFENTRIDEGYYFKDHRSSPERDYEFIEFEKPVNVWRVESRINFFDGRAPASPGGEVRIEFGGRIYTGAFSVAARKGNEGRSGPGQEQYWFDLDIPRILKLRDGSQASAATRAE
jgi:hypothetical protein